MILENVNWQIDKRETHRVEEIVPVFNKTLFLKEGQVFAAGNTSEMISNEKLTQFFELPVQVHWENNRPFVSRVQVQV
ncbi:hypothetical protein ACIQAA_17840 [Neobacillus sp. NPDC093182]|uniref:hypothetical protein n=1 Tax=Neobacillus sp. NPDC093182 TaxID=3364297 RepID=UPI0037FAA6CB